MNFGATGALDDAPSQDGFLNLDQMTDMITHCIKTNLSVADDDTVNVADIGPLVNIPADALKDYANSIGRISIDGIVTCAVSQLAQNNVRSIRAETQDTQTRHQNSTLRRLTGELRAITRRQSEMLGTQAISSFDPVPSVTSMLGSNTQVLGSIAGSTHLQGFNIANFNELKTKNSDLSIQLSKADTKIAELKKLVLDKDYEIAQLNERIRGLMVDVASAPPLLQQAPAISSAEIQSLQASFSEPLIILRGMLQDLHTAIVPTPSHGLTDNPISDEKGLLDMDIRGSQPSMTLKEQVAKTLTAVEHIIEKQHVYFKQLEEKDANILKALIDNSEAIKVYVSSTQDNAIDTLERKMGSSNSRLVDTIKDYLDQLLASASTSSASNPHTACSGAPGIQVSDAISPESRIPSRIELREAIKDVVDASYEPFLTKLNNIQEELTRVEKADSANAGYSKLTSTDMTNAIAAQTNELSLILSNMPSKVTDGVSTYIERYLSNIQAELSCGMQNLKNFLDKGSETLARLTEMPGKSSTPQPLTDSIAQHWDANLVDKIAQGISLKIQTKLDQLHNALLLQSSGAQADPYDQRSTLVSKLLQTFIDSVFPGLNEGIQEVITRQFTIHMETLAEEQLRFAEALCRDFKSLQPDGNHGNHSQQIALSEATRLENTIPMRASQSTVLMRDDNPNCSPQEMAHRVSKLLEKKAPVISGIITKASKRSLAAASRRDSGRLEDSALIVFNDENDNIIDALVKEKDLLSVCPGLANEEIGLQGKPLTEISLAIDQICTQPMQSNAPESFHTLKFPQYSFQALQHYLPETNTKLDLIEDHILQQFAEVRSSIDGLTKSINTSVYITSSEAARMRQEYRDVAMTIDDVNDGLAAVIESESARTLSNLRHIVWADYITVTAIFVLTLVIFFNLLVVFTAQNCN